MISDSPQGVEQNSAYRLVSFLQNSASMYQTILLLVATLLSISSYSQRVTENLVQELYYVDGEIYSAYYLNDSLGYSVFYENNDPRTPNNPQSYDHIDFIYKNDSIWKSTQFRCKVIDTSKKFEELEVDCENVFYAISTREASLDNLGNEIFTENTLYYFEEYLRKYLLNELMGLSRVESRKYTLNVAENKKKTVVNKIGNKTITKKFEGGWQYRETVEEILPNKDIERLTKQYIYLESQESYSLYSEKIEHKSDSTINTTSSYYNYGKVKPSFYKYIEVVNEAGDLIYKARFSGRRRSEKKPVKFKPDYEITYQYFGENLERRTVTWGETKEKNLIEIRRWYSE
jgi:hypothetical protein